MLRWFFFHTLIKNPKKNSSLCNNNSEENRRKTISTCCDFYETNQLFIHGCQRKKSFVFKSISVDIYDVSITCLLSFYFKFYSTTLSNVLCEFVYKYKHTEKLAFYGFFYDVELEGLFTLELQIDEDLKWNQEFVMLN